MATRTAHLIAKLTDQVSGPAAKMADGLKKAAAQADALNRMSSKGGTRSLTDGLRNLGASASQIDAVTAAMKRYAAAQMIPANRADWTKAQAAQMRSWEKSTVASLKNVIRAEREAAAAARDMASAQMSAAVKAGQAARLQQQARRESIRERRREAATTIASGAGLVAAHKGKKIGLDAIQSAADFDIAVRKQKEFTDITSVDQASLLTQAKRVGQETKFSNEDVVKAQTASMQGLPASFGPELKAAVAQGIVENVKSYAILMDTDLKEGAETIRSYLQATGKDISTREKAVSEANKATNQPVKMAKLGGMSGEDVAQYVKYAAASSTSAGLSTESVLSLGALARRGGLRGDEAGVFMRATSNKLVSPTKKGLAAYNAAGIDHSSFVKMPETLSTSALEGQFRMDVGKGFTPAIRQKLDTINADKTLLADRGKYVEAVTSAVSPILGKTKGGTVRASDAQTAAKAAGNYHKVAAQSVDTEGLLDALMRANPTLAQLNAILTDKHGGKGAITQRQWEEFKASRAEIQKSGSDPDYAKKKADEIMAGLGGAVENLKGSWENFILTVGTANAELIKSTADGLGNAIDSFSKLDKGTQQALSIAGGGAALAGGGYGAFNLGKALLGFGGSSAALTGSAGALTASAGLLDAAALKIIGGNIGGSIGAGAGAAAGAGAGGAAAGGVSLGLGGTAILGGAVVGGSLDMMTPGTTAGLTSLTTGAESSLEQTNRALAAERTARDALKGTYSPDSMGRGRAMAPLDGTDARKGFTSEYSASRGAIGDFLFGQEKKAIILPPLVRRLTAPTETDAASAAPPRNVPLPPSRPPSLAPKADVTLPEIKVEVDSSGFDEAKRKADETKAKLDELSGITVAPQGNTAGIDAVTASARQAAAALREVIALGGQAQTTIGKVNAAAASTAKAAGTTRTGAVRSAQLGAYTDRGMET